MGQGRKPRGGGCALPGWRPGPMPASLRDSGCYGGSFPGLKPAEAPGFMPAPLRGLLRAFGAAQRSWSGLFFSANSPVQETRSTPMATTFSNLLYHLVFSTKNRQPSIRAEIREPLYEYMGGILRAEGGILLEIGGVPDHVHLLAKMKTDVAVSVVVKEIKAKSSKWLNERPAPWSGSNGRWATGSSPSALRWWRKCAPTFVPRRSTTGPCPSGTN